MQLPLSFKLLSVGQWWVAFLLPRALPRAIMLRPFRAFIFNHNDYYLPVLFVIFLSLVLLLTTFYSSLWLIFFTTKSTEKAQRFFCSLPLEGLGEAPILK